MKKTLLVLALLAFAINTHAATTFMADTVKKDTAKINKQIKELKSKLTELTVELTTVQNRIPADSAKMQDDIDKSHTAQEKSKKSASNAVGGDVGDAKKAEKLAKKAANITDDANDDTKQLEKDRKKVKSLSGDIEDTQKKLDKLQSPQ